MKVTRERWKCPKFVEIKKIHELFERTFFL